MDKSEAASSSESTDFTALKKESIALDHRFSKWQSSRVPEFKPTVIRHVSSQSQQSESEIPAISY